MSDYRFNVIWDFDGVIADSNAIKGDAFNELFSCYTVSQRKSMVRYHFDNPGLSRQEKIKYFYESILKQSSDEEIMQEKEEEFSRIILRSMTCPRILNRDVIEFISENKNVFVSYIASASNGAELNYICHELDIFRLFESIRGGPTRKELLISEIINQNRLLRDNTLYIGDSFADYLAAVSNNIKFVGYGNVSLTDVGVAFVKDLSGISPDFFKDLI